MESQSGLLSSFAYFLSPSATSLQTKSVSKFGSSLQYSLGHFFGLPSLIFWFCYYYHWQPIFLFAKQKRVGILQLFVVDLWFAVSLSRCYLTFVTAGSMHWDCLTLISNLFQDEVSTQLHFLKQIWRSFYTAVEVWVGVSFENSNLPVAILFCFGHHHGGYLYTVGQKNRPSKWCLPLLWIAITISSFSMYPGDTPPYYYLIMMPAVFVVLLTLLGFLPSLVRRTILGLFLLLVAGTQITAILPHNPFSITAACNTFRILLATLLQEKFKVLPTICLRETHSV